jgi:hypothetical protein
MALDSSLSKLPIIASMKPLVLLLCTLFALSGNAQDDPYYGKIKLRKPGSVAFFVDVDETPLYIPGRLEEAIYSGLARPEPWNSNDYDTKGLVVMRVIADAKGNVIHVEAKTTKSALTQEARRMIEKLGRFQPHQLDGKPVSVRFDIPVNFNW